MIWNSIQSKLENLGQTLDGRDQNLDVSQGRTIPERGTSAIKCDRYIWNYLFHFGRKTGIIYATFPFVVLQVNKLWRNTSQVKAHKNKMLLISLTMTP